MAPALGCWNKCVSKLSYVAENLRAEDTPYLSFLSNGPLTEPSALVHDWLCHVCSIQVRSPLKK